jgi:hypothetical protein
MRAETRAHLSLSLAVRLRRFANWQAAQASGPAAFLPSRDSAPAAGLFYRRQ